MEEDLKTFFDTAEQLLQTHNPQTDCRLKQHLSRQIQGKLPCMYVYHAWALAAMCCASDWSLDSLEEILYKSGYAAPVSDILKDLFHSLRNTAIPQPKDTQNRDVSRRILLLDTLTRVQLDQAARLEVELYTLTGRLLK